MIGKRHSASCLCGCQFVEGLAGRVVESVPDVDLIVAEFVIPSYTGTGPRTQRVAYSVAEMAI